MIKIPEQINFMIKDLILNGLENSKLRLPEPKDKLWVVKPIRQYESVYLEECIKFYIVKKPDFMPETQTSKSIEI